MSDISVRKSFDEYELYIFDLDGTLYYQRQLRFVMAKRLACFYITHPLRIKELFIVKKFREVREKWTDTESDAGKSIDEAQYEYVAEKMGVSYEKVHSVIQKWIYDNPLDAVAKSKDEKLSQIIARLENAGKRVVIFSDYPVEDKLRALGIKADGKYCSAMNPIEELKPSSKGIDIILNDFSVRKEDAIMIGDRMSKDGECAKGAGVDYLILDKSASKRDVIYKGYMKKL